MAKIESIYTKPLSGVIVTVWLKDAQWQGRVKAQKGNYISKIYNHYACPDENQACRETLEDWLKDAVELALAGVLWFTFTEEIR